MTIAAIAYCLFTFFNSLRIISYLPQIHRVAHDTRGASCISCLTWMLWTVANASTSFYAFANLGDLMLGLVHLLNTVCCLIVIGLTLVKRRQYRRCYEREDISVDVRRDARRSSAMGRRWSATIRTMQAYLRPQPRLAGARPPSRSASGASPCTTP